MTDRFTRAADAFETGLIAHPEVGKPVGDYDGPRNMDQAPTGEPYVEVTSDGVWDAGASIPGWYSSKTFALELWSEAARAYAKTRGRHLYWRDKPRWVEAEFIPVDQVAALNDPVLRRVTVIKVGFIYSRLLVSTMDPTGKEDSDAGQNPENGQRPVQVGDL